MLLDYSLNIVSRVELKAELGKFCFITSHLKEQTIQTKIPTDILGLS